jgi:hypothetical protein
MNTCCGDDFFNGYLYLSTIVLNSLRRFVYFWTGSGPYLLEKLELGSARYLESDSDP